MTNTTKQGDSYEAKVSALVTSLLKTKTLPFDGDSSVLHRRKSYHSADRHSEIVFENVLELFAKGVDRNSGQPALVIIFECKSYKNLVDVSELEEFDSKMSQIKGFQKKGYMVTTRGFKRAALSFAKSKGIGLIRFMPKEQYQFVLYHMTSLTMRDDGFAQRAVRGLTDPDYIARNETEYAYDDGLVFRSAEYAVKHSIDEYRSSELEH